MNIKPIVNHKGWQGGLVDWIDASYANISVVFSWQIQQAYQKAIWYKSLGYTVRIGGPAAKCRPDIFKDVAQVNGVELDALEYHNPQATYTTRGCPRNCPFCIVRIIEPEFTELKDFIPRPIVCDNNYLASSKRHFDYVIDSLKPISSLDFNQGLDVRYINDYRMSRLAELDIRWLRLAWDDIKDETAFMDGVRIVQKYMPNNRISVYVLIGFQDTPDDALYRLNTIRGMGFKAFPMRYQPWDSTKKNSYVAPNWTHRELRRYMLYWSHMYLSRIPFEEFILDKH